MIDKRSGTTNRPSKQQDSYFNNEPRLPDRNNVQPSQRKGPKSSPFCN